MPPYDPAIHHRRSIRLRGYDYTRPGEYFVTCRTQGRRPLFGIIVNGRMALNDAGRMVRGVWDEMPAHYPGVECDEFIVMPDHLHAVVRLVSPVGAGPRACPLSGTGQARGPEGQARGPAPTMSLPDAVHRLKSLTTTRYIAGVADHGWPRFDGRLWQRNYYEIIVRDAAALAKIRAYIRDNPAHADVRRFGEPRPLAGNPALLGLPLTAFLASRGGPAVAPRLDPRPDGVISGFLSPMERAVFDACLADGTPLVWVLAKGLVPPLMPAARRALDAGRLLILSPFDAAVAAFSAQRAAWCNQYVLHAAVRVVIGHLAPDGMLAILLSDLPEDKPVTVLGG